MDELQKAIIKTLSYADIFDYPLLPPEITRYLIFSRPASPSAITRALQDRSFSNQIGADGRVFFLKGKDRSVKLRKKRETLSRKKMEKAVRLTRWLTQIPTVRMVGLSGALAMMNAETDDDIDLFLIVSPKRLWLTRGIIVFSLRLLRLYRRPGKTKDKICPNLFLDEDHLSLPAQERNLFTAHEIAQVKCLWDEEETYNRFLVANRWVLDYLPNAFDMKGLEKASPRRCAFALLRGERVLDWLEKLAYHLQLFYMRSKRTREVVEPGRVFFHPRDRGAEILLKYRQRLKKLGVDP